MPPLLDEMQVSNALRDDALPALERLADRPGLRDRAPSRFDRDEPPPYESSTDDEECAMLHPALGLHHGNTVLDEFKDLMDTPVNEDEQRRIARTLSEAYNPGERYRTEQSAERSRVDGFAWSYRASSDDAKKFLLRTGGAGTGW